MNATASTAAQGLVPWSQSSVSRPGVTIVSFYLCWNHRRKVRLIEQGIAPRTEFDPRRLRTAPAGGQRERGEARPVVEQSRTTSQKGDGV